MPSSTTLFSNSRRPSARTEISIPAMIAPVASNHGSSESFNPFKLVETGD
jgi:hypothetical protein